MQETLKALDLEQSVGLNILQKQRKPNSKVIIEGLDVLEPQWCLVDGGRAIVHVMTEQARQTWEVEAVALANPNTDTVS